jgi:primosomal protein N'
VIDLRRLAYAERKNKTLFSKFLIDTIASTLAQKGKVLLLINRKGFATSAACHNCGDGHLWAIHSNDWQENAR